MPLTDSLLDNLIAWLLASLIDWLIDWLIDRMINWLLDWLTITFYKGQYHENILHACHRLNHTILRDARLSHNKDIPKILLLGDMLFRAYHLLYLSKSLFVYYCKHDSLGSLFSEMAMTITFTFSQYLWHDMPYCKQAFQCDHSTMTSSRCHFVNSRYHSYLHNQASQINQIHYTLTSGHGSAYQHIHVRTRVKILKLLIMTFWTKESTNQVILSISNSSARARLRADFCGRAPRWSQKRRVLLMHGSDFWHIYE